MTELQWMLPWDFSFFIPFILITTALAFVRGRQKTNISRSRQFLFWGSLALVDLVAFSQFDYFAEHQFLLHRFQHIVLHHLVPFLFALSDPFQTLWCGLPARMQPILSSIARQRIFVHIGNFMRNPYLVTFIFVAFIYVWLPPRVHTLAMLDWRLYRLMNWGMLVTGLLFWQRAIGLEANRDLSLGARIAMLLAVIPPQIFAGAILLYADRDLYPIYRMCGRALPAISAIEDQQIGGLILWLPPAMMSVLGTIFIIVRAAKEQPTRSKD